LSRAAAINRNRLPGLEAIGGAVPVTNAVGAPPFAREDSTTALTFLLFPADVGRHRREALARRLVDRYVREPADGFVGVTGALPARTAQYEIIRDSLPLVEICTMLLVALAVGLHYRAVLAPAINLVGIAIAYLVAVRLMAWTGQRLEVSVPSEVEPVMIVLLFGVLSDYAIFFLSRFRRRLAEGDAPTQAAVATARDIVPIVVTAGLTVIAAAAALVVADLGFLQAFGPGLAMAVLVGLAVAVTFIPAALAIAGHASTGPAVRAASCRARPRPRSPPTNGPGGRCARGSSGWPATGLARLGSRSAKR
jgi:RND superfamily putative drug exporter